ncbi:hypothetical protein GWI33_017442 [Rhynchophorus ferrugineus]|uniref:Serpin domain-containing protein n=1 Tax=Rhynchophorus ferrugineus TaxID=354439 RepID=A0A834M674_RHYFE|nr:hypothetical protein GWI33_017442 [Rhynchophorus ferrugineus]
MILKPYIPWGTILFYAGIIYTQEKFNIAESINKFSIDLLHATASHANDVTNIALSPFTIWTLLSIIAEGSYDSTADQLNKALRQPQNKNSVRDTYQRLGSSLGMKSDGAEFETSTGIFPSEEYKIKEKFRSVIKQFYNSSIQSMNYNDANSAASTINKYVSSATKNRIPNLINPHDVVNAKLFLTTTMYFKGQWQVPFNQTATRPADFFNENKNKIGTVDMMYQSYPYPYGRLDKLKAFALELPYGFDDQFSMLILLPRGAQTTQNILNALKGESITDILALLNRNHQKFDDNINVSLPKFKITSDFNMDTPLYEMGIKDMFDSQRANLLGIFNHYVYVSRIIQKAEIEVDEEGTVATAAGGAVILNRIPPPNFLANRPFLYFIVHKTSGTVIFAGRVSNPQTLR